MRAAGIDVGKANLDLAVEGQPGVDRFANNRAGITKLIKRLEAMDVQRIVVEATGGAHFTSCVPDYERDEAFQKSYAASAKTPEAWADFKAAWLDLSEADYQAKRAAETEGAT